MAIKLTSRFHLIPRLRKCGALQAVPHAFPLHCVI